MTSFGYRLNPRYAIKECSSCGTLYTRECSCSKGNVKDKIIVPKPPKNCARCARCGHPVDGLYCQGCTFLRKKLEEDLVTRFQGFQNTSEDLVTRFQGFQNTFPRLHVQGVDTPQTLPSFDPMCYFEKENSSPCVSKPNSVEESPNVFNPPPQPFIHTCEFCGSNAQYGHYCIPQVPLIYPEPAYNEVIKSSVEDLVPIPSESEDEEIEDDNLREKLLKVNFLIAEIEALKDNPTPSSEFLTKSSSTSPKSVLEETNTFDNSLPEFENICFDLEEISSGSTTTHSDISLSEYDSFIFDLLNDQFPPTDRSDFTYEEFGDEPAQIISPPEYDCFYFRDLPNPGELISSLNSRIRENVSSTTCVNLLVEDDYSPLLAYVVWIFLAYLTYPVIPPHLYSFGNEDTIVKNKREKGQNRNKTGPNQEKTGSVEKPGSVEDQSQSRHQKKEENIKSKDQN
nr:hypothetical protein [Tanacetum cinerariifolium]